MEFWSTTRRAGGQILLAALLLAGRPAAAQDQPTARAAAARPVAIAFVDRAEDPWYAVVNGRDGVFRPTRKSARPGVELAVKDAAATGRALGTSFTMVPRTLAPDEPIAPALAALRAQGATAAILDVPADDLKAAARETPPGLVLFDIRSRDDALRAETCAAPLIHILPSRGAGTDAIVQFLVKRNWKRILVLHGPEPKDKQAADAVQASARKFGARIVETKPFAVSNDPRRREETNVTLLSGGAGEYDVVYVADEQGDVSRSIPFRLSLPRPVVGSEGLRAVAWHPYYERNGAPQLERRYERFAGAPMSEEAWAGWAAVRAVVEATASAAGNGAALEAQLMRPDMTLELYKAFPGSIRPWDRSLRQAVLLATYDSVIDLAPIEGFLHETNVLDTLGLLPSQTPCGRQP
jgi:ABC transporter substrate binding protein (PQQ-dependent alcohol dehydrogenase system)